MTTQHLYHTPVTKSKKVFTHQNTANKEYGIHSVLFGITVILFIFIFKSPLVLFVNMTHST
jgi:hypothetical protein